MNVFFSLTKTKLKIDVKKHFEQKTEIKYL